MLVLLPWPALAGWLIWWLKPLFDRVLLHVLSRAAFGQQCTVREVVRELPRLWRGPGVLTGLTLRRLSPARSFLLPVWQLEEQRGGMALARFRLLSRRYQGFGVWLTVFCANMSLVLVFATLATLALLLPGDDAHWSIWEWFTDDSALLPGLLGNLAYLCAETLVEPLYVASGFSLYLNRRSELEGWDIEVGLRRLAERHAAQTAVTSLCWLPALVLACACTFAVTPAWAGGDDDSTRPSESSESSATPAAAAEDSNAELEGAVAGDGQSGGPVAPDTAVRRAIDAVLADPVFGYEKDDWTWRWRKPDEPEKVAASDDGWRKGLLPILEWIAEVIRIALWIGAGVTLAALIAVVVRHRLPTTDTARRGSAGWTFAIDLVAGALPSDVAAAARAALADGRGVEALSLLYRGALAAVVAQRQIDLVAGDTESDCLRRVQGALPATAGSCFAELVATWQLAAYAHRLPPTSQLARLIDDWDQHFGPQGRNA